MYNIQLTRSSAHDCERYDDELSPKWETIACGQANTEAEAKSLVLEEVLEMLNNEELLPTNEWLRLEHYDLTSDKRKPIKIEVF